jgi:hypothetical protein
MTRKFIPIEEVAKEWMKDPEFVAAYDALEDEFAVASALIKGARRSRHDAGTGGPGHGNHAGGGRPPGVTGSMRSSKR